MAEVSEEIMRDRQTWFWRRVTLQVVIFILSSVLAAQVYLSSGKTDNWPAAIVSCTIIAAIAWLVTMYFAMANNVAKVTGLISTVGDSVGHARQGGGG